MKVNPECNVQTYLSDLAITRAGASRVFHRHGLDFCCHGHVSLQQACEAAGLSSQSVLEEIEAEGRDQTSEFARWDQAPISDLIDHILVRFHEDHRRELPRLLAMARKVESVHADKASCPHGLAEHLAFMTSEMELHMQKEEQVLFPLLRSGAGRMAGAPIQAMEAEHEDHGVNLERLRQLAHQYEPPADACATWQALYLGLSELERDLMEHISLENNALFPRALRG